MYYIENNISFWPLPLIINIILNFFKIFFLPKCQKDISFSCYQEVRSMVHTNILSALWQWSQCIASHLWLGSRGTGVPYSQWPFSPEEDHCQDIRLLHYDWGRKSVGLTILKRFLTVPKITSSWKAKYRNMIMGSEWPGHQSENG